MAVVLGACAGTGGDRDAGGSGGAGAAAPSLTGKPGCFYARDAQDFRVLGTGSLLVFAPDAAHAYQVTITPAAWELRSAFGISFAGSGGRICGAAGDRLFVDGGGSRQGYSVIAVNALDRAAVELLSGRAKGPKAPPPAPAGVPGAAIETDPDEGAD
ncbi:MAG: hypothetical protein JNM50_12630 [Chromatiales bacterium]|jgi:hypothetical protein|nr:hypothetical protein [Chromatiales bacterium]